MKKKRFSIHFKNFILCGILGWFLECFWTGMGSIFHKDPKLKCNTSIWMFPIYGLASFLHPLHQAMKNRPLIVRGSIYTMLIYITELLTGTLLTKRHACPWDYSKSSYNYKGLIRLDYLPAWFGMGLLYEKVLVISTRLFRKQLKTEKGH